MTETIKGISIVIGSDTTGLSAALSEVNKKSRDIQTELRQVEKLLKFDPKNTELLAQKQKLLADAVGNSKDKLDSLKAAQEQVNEQFRKGEINEGQYRAFQREVAKAEQELAGLEKQLESASAASKTFGEKLQNAAAKLKPIGENLTKHVTVPLTAAGAGMVAAGKKFDDAFDKIRLSTGKTGKALESLNDDFRKVAQEVPSSFDEISTAVAQYNVRLGISGKTLQDLSAQTLNLSRITETDLGTVIEETSQAFQAFSIPVVKYGDSLDYVFKVAQSTGISITRLESILVKFAPALKQMGFDFYESAALMGFFDKAGVEVEQAMAGLNKALVNMAKDGVKDANEALLLLFEEIKKAPTDIKGTEIAIEVFGSKAGPLLASAIREGKLSYQELVQEILGSTETINDAADATDDWAEGLLKLQNRVLIATEPLAVSFFDAINKLIDPLEKQLIPDIEKLAVAFEALPDRTQGAAAGVLGFVWALGPLLIGLGMMANGVRALAPVFALLGAILTGVFTGLIAAIQAWAGTISTIVVGLAQVIATAVTAIAAALGISVGAMVAILAGLIAIGVLLYKNWDEIKAFGLQLWADLKTGWTEGMASIKVAWVEFGQTIKATWENMWNSIKTWYDQTKENLITATTNLTDGMITKWSNFKTGFMNIWTAIVGALKGYVNNIIGFINKLIDALNTIQVDIPDWVPIYGGNSFGIDIANVPYLATGGIVTRPTLAMIGESGPEAVIPLNRMGPSIGTINIYGSNASEIWSKFERELNRRGVRI